MASTMQLEFAQAMSDFKTMFPDMDRDVIEAVLRANQGAVDATIDQLLAMSTDNQNELLRNELEDPDAVPSVTNDSTKNNDLLLGIPVSINTGASPKIKKNVEENSESLKDLKKWKPPLLGPLPLTFLRITLPDVRPEYDLPDEQFALMLQNEEFMNELRWNQEFMSALEKEQGKDKPDDETAFKERVRYMGKKSRKKFMQLAKVFTWQRNKKSSSVKHNPPPDSLLLEEDYDGEEDAPRKNKK